MATIYSHPAPDGADPRPTSRYIGAAALCEAIKAAAALAPEEFPVFVPPFPAGAYKPSPDTCEQDDSGRWMHTEWAGPLMPAAVNPDQTRRRVEFRFTDGAGSRSLIACANLRAPLLAMADRVRSHAAAYDGKTRRVRMPQKPRAGSAPHVVAREMLASCDYAAALQVADSAGAVFFGRGTDGIPVLYMAAELVDIVGHPFTLARHVSSGRFVLLGDVAGLSLPNKAAARDDFATSSAALAWAESIPQDEPLCEKIRKALNAAAPFSQTDARAWYESRGASAAPDAAPDAAPNPVDVAQAAELAPSADAAPSARSGLGVEIADRGRGP